MIPGLFLLLLLGLAVAFRWKKLRKRRGLGVSRGHWVAAAAVFGVAVAALWMTQR